jgi:hypothetical protein
MYLFYNIMHDDILKLIKPIPLKYLSKSTICMKCNLEDKKLNELEDESSTTPSEGDDEPDDVKIDKQPDDEPVPDKRINVIVRRAVKKLVADTTARTPTG